MNRTTADSFLINTIISVLDSTFGFTNPQRFISYPQSNDFDHAYFEKQMTELEEQERKRLDSE